MDIKYTHITIGLLILAILILVKCNSDTSKTYKKQQLTSQNNIETLNDSLYQFKAKNGSLITQSRILISDKKDLKSLNKELYKTVRELEKDIQNIKPQVVIKWKTRIVHDTTYINPKTLYLNDSTFVLTFRKDTLYDEFNSRFIEGNFTINLIDSNSKYNKLRVSDIAITKDETNITASLVLGMKDDKLSVFLKSDYPGFDIDKVDAVILDEDIHPELRKLNNKKNISIGPYFGLGLGKDFNIQPSIGLGVQYNLIKL